MKNTSHRKLAIRARQLYELGKALGQQGRLDEAASAYEQAVSVEPTFVEAHNNLGTLRLSQGRLPEARACYEKARSLAPHVALPYLNLGITLSAIGELDEAVEYYKRALTIQPNLAEAHVRLGSALRLAEKPTEAISCYRKAIAIRPSLAEAHAGLGNVLLEQNEPADAVASYRQAIGLRPDYAAAHTSLAFALRCEGNLNEALDSARRAVMMRPDSADARMTEAALLLLAGDYEAGWKQYEWRWRTKHMTPPTFAAPLWTGEDLRGRTILLHSEQGLGDAIQFVRYAPLVKERGGRVLLSCPASLARLFETVSGIDRIYPDGLGVSAFDVHAPLMSLPLVFQTTLDSIPKSVPYISAIQEQRSLWAERLRPFNGLKVGLVWAGNSHYGNRALHFAVDQRRNMRLEQFAPLATMSNVQFVSLQKGPGMEAAKNSRSGLRLVDFMNEVGDFADTAALIANLDLVISVDTSVAHLAGAMGIPVWMLSRYDGCWRWLWDRDDSPWYPTLRVFRQPRMGDWASLIEDVRSELSQRVSM